MTNKKGVGGSDWGFTPQKHNMIIRDSVVEGSGATLATSGVANTPRVMRIEIMIKGAVPWHYAKALGLVSICSEFFFHPHYFFIYCVVLLSESRNNTIYAFLGFLLLAEHTAGMYSLVLFAEDLVNILRFGQATTYRTHFEGRF